MKKLSNTKKINIFLSIISLILIIGYFVIPYTESRYLSSSKGSNNLKVATWNFKINGTSSEKIEINLIDTLTANNYSTNKIIPGSEGMISLEVDCTDTKVALDYEITIDNDNFVLPDNLKLYVDENYTTEFTSFQKTVLLPDIGIFNHKIYWKWLYTTDDETTEWSNKDLKLYLKATAIQKIEEAP